MEWLRRAGAWCWSNLGNLALIGGWFVSAGVPPWVLSLSEGVEPIWYVVAAFGGLLAFAAVRALWWRANLWIMDARFRRKITDSSSPFDPMDSVFQSKRIMLTDLIPAGRKLIQRKKFIGCEIIGPGTIVVAIPSTGNPNPVFHGNYAHDVDCIEVDPQTAPNNATIFLDCDFESCHFYSLNLLFFNRDEQGLPWNWITKESAQIALPDETESNDE